MCNFLVVKYSIIVLLHPYVHSVGVHILLLWRLENFLQEQDPLTHRHKPCLSMCLHSRISQKSHPRIVLKLHSNFKPEQFSTFAVCSLFCSCTAVFCQIKLLLFFSSLCLKDSSLLLTMSVIFSGF